MLPNSSFLSSATRSSVERAVQSCSARRGHSAAKALVSIHGTPTCIRHTHTPSPYYRGLLVGCLIKREKRVAVAPVVVVGVNRGQNGHRSSTNWLLWLEQQPRALTTALTRYPGRMKEELARYMRRERCTRRHIRRTGAKGGQLRLWEDAA